MSNGIVVLIVTYAGICMGTFLNLRRLNNDFLKALLIAIVAPIPVFLYLRGQQLALRSKMILLTKDNIVIFGFSY